MKQIQKYKNTKTILILNQKNMKIENGKKEKKKKSEKTN